MTLDIKISNAKLLLEKVLKEYNKIVVMSSFGKDSQVMIHLLKTMGIKLPLLQHKDPWADPRKYEFSDAQIIAEGYEMHDYLPQSTSITNDGEAITSFYSVGPQVFLWIGKDVFPPQEGKPTLCGLEMYNRPTTSSFPFPWDLCLVGHRSDDVDLVQGPVPLKVDVHTNEVGPDYCFPLRHFTLEDIWSYTDKFGVAQNYKRYDRNNSYKNFSDISYNDDRYEACVACLSRKNPSIVRCPKFGLVANISSTLRHTTAPKLDYINN